MVDSTPKTTTIQLTRGFEAIVNECDADLANFKWFAQSTSHGNFYAARRDYQISGSKFLLMHRVVLERALGRVLLSSEHVDHKDRNEFNNTRDNLRLATRSQNAANARLPINSTTGYRGVSYLKNNNKWVSLIKVNQKSINLGSFDTSQDAAIAYNHAAVKYFGEFAYINDIPNWKDITPKPADRFTLSKANTSGIVGVYWEQLQQSWGVRLTVNGKKRRFGLYKTIEEAADVRQRIIEEYGL